MHALALLPEKRRGRGFGYPWPVTKFARPSGTWFSLSRWLKKGTRMKDERGDARRKGDFVSTFVSFSRWFSALTSAATIETTFHLSIDLFHSSNQKQQVPHS